jgi:hypothetical protein
MSNTNTAAVDTVDPIVDRTIHPNSDPDHQAALPPTPPPRQAPDDLNLYNAPGAPLRPANVAHGTGTPRRLVL